MGSSGLGFDTKPLGRIVQQSSIVHGRRPSFVAVLRASVDLGHPSDHGEKRLLRMLLVLQLEWRIHGMIIQSKTDKTEQCESNNDLNTICG